MKIASIRPEFVDRIPRTLTDGVLYVSEKFGTAAHNCCCGCGTKVITPLKAGRWSLKKDSNGISLFPSVGNWSSSCQSHYWIRNNRIDWAQAYSAEEIAANRVSDQAARQRAHADRYRRERPFWKRVWDAISGLWRN